MGNLIIKKVIYSGERYSFESPELSSGINIIVGDNGSGKSTFSYFIEFGLGGDVFPFKKSDNSNYLLIIEDTNNFVQLDILIDETEFTLKRYIGTNDIFFNENGKVNKLPIKRNSTYAPRTFSDWLLEKLSIKVFTMSLGTMNWEISFTDIYRLLNHDQDSDPRKIYKSPSVYNFISDSSIIRKSIFETLVGLTSEKYNIKYNEFKKAETLRNESKSALDNFMKTNSEIDNYLLNDIRSEIENLENKLSQTIDKRVSYQKQNTNSEAKIDQLDLIQSELIEKELDVSRETIEMKNLIIENTKINKLLESLNTEIKQIEKIIFTHDKLNLFSFEICPFCMKEVEYTEGQCLCGSVINDDDYTKYVYKSSEYKEILDYKNKSIKTIKFASESFSSDIEKLSKNITITKERCEILKNRIKHEIDAISFSGNSQIIDQLNDDIFKFKEEIFQNNKILEGLTSRDIIEKDHSLKEKDYATKKDEYNKEVKQFNKSNLSTIKEFNEIYGKLLVKSSCECKHVEINDDYMPYIDYGVYKEKSTIVPIRLMYYLTLLSLSLKYEIVKHPKFLIIDTPEEAGIDKSNLKHNLSLLDYALELSKKTDSEKVKDYQVILTTGEDKYPDIYKKYIKIKLNKKNQIFILKENQKNT